MTDKSRKYSFAAGILFLAGFIAGVYEYVLSILSTAKVLDESPFKVLEQIFKSKETLKAHILIYALFLVLLVLLIAMFTENRGVFFVGVLLAAGLFAYRMYYWADVTSKYNKNWKWDSMKTFTFIYSCVLAGVVLVFLLCTAIALLAKAPSVTAFATLSVIFTAFIIGISIAADFLAIYSKDWEAGTWSKYLSRFQADNMGSVVTILSQFLEVLMVGRWASLKCEALNGVKNTAAPIDQSQQPQVAAATFFQAQQPIQPNNRPIYPAQPAQAPVQPAQAPVQPAAPAPPAPAPVQNAAPTAPAPAPIQPVKPADAPQAASKVEEAAAVAASVNAVKESLKASGPSAEEIEAAYEKISNTTDLSKEVSYTVDNLSDDMAAKLARLSEEAAKEVASGKEDDLSDALERIGEKVEKKTEEAAEAVEKAEDAAESAADAVDDAAEDVTKKFTDAAESAADTVTEAVEDVSEAADDVAATAEEAAESAESLTDDVTGNE